MKYVFEPASVRLIRPKWGECLLCNGRRDEMIYVKDLRAIICPEHEAYAVVGEYDNGYYRNQWVEGIHASEQEASAKARELNRLIRENRLISGFQPKSYFTTRLRNLLNQRSIVTELEKDVEDSW